MFQHTAARRRLAESARRKPCNPLFQHTAARRRLGLRKKSSKCVTKGFNTQPPEGGWQLLQRALYVRNVSTHSRPKAAGGMVEKLEAAA